MVVPVLIIRGNKQTLQIVSAVEWIGGLLLNAYFVTSDGQEDFWSY